MCFWVISINDVRDVKSRCKKLHSWLTYFIFYIFITQKSSMIVFFHYIMQTIKCYIVRERASEGQTWSQRSFAPQNDMDTGGWKSRSGSATTFFHSFPEKFGGKKQANSFLLDKYLSVESYKNGHIPSLYSLLRPVHLPLITWYLIKSSAPI